MKFSDRQEDDIQINLTPLIDVVFLLLIFFMVSTTFSKESELRIQLPESSDEPTLEATSEILEIEISSEGAYSIKGPADDTKKALLNTDRKTLHRALVAATGGRSRYCDHHPGG